MRAKTDISVDRRDASTTEPDMAAFIERTEERLASGPTSISVRL